MPCDFVLQLWFISCNEVTCKDVFVEDRLFIGHLWFLSQSFIGYNKMNE